MTSSASITITPERLYAAMAAAGMHVDQATMDQCIAEAAQRLSDEIDEQVFQDLLKELSPKEVPVEPENIAGIWGTLRTLDPYDSGASLHVHEARYSLHGVRYVVYWEIGGSDVPFDIAILKD
jgi:D-serine dehydratase